jgi:hypothetical protein
MFFSGKTFSCFFRKETGPQAVNERCHCSLDQQSGSHYKFLTNVQRVKSYVVTSTMDHVMWLYI